VSSVAINPIESFRLLGVRVHAVQIPDAVAEMERWIEEKQGCHYVAVTGMHGVMEAQQDALFKQILNTADLVVSDGMPLVWAGRQRGFDGMKRRVYGPELMMAFCAATQGKGYRHYFYGGADGVPERLADTLSRRFEGFQVAGCYSPPFRPLTPDEDLDIVQKINESGADILWVGLSTPKQEKWMYEHRDKLRVPVLMGVGAAFDLNTGRLTQAPAWMREHGMEWFFRLVMEPRRLWRRYLLLGPRFAWNVSLEMLKLKQYQ
jgi:N-acetylglucosaminyldiphosphoundecaprenol N-acetyl-beta-D-mannosaminyltransferase